MSIATPQPSTSPLELVIAHFEGPLGASRRLRKPRALLYITAAMTVCFLVWMAFAQVDRVVRTQGRVIPSGKTQLVQHLEGGIVSNVFVREGDVVRRGQNLIAVSDLMASSSSGEKKAHLRGLMAKAARLKAEADASSFAVPETMSATDPEISNELSAFQARQSKLRESVRVFSEQAVQKRQEIAEQEVRRKGLEGELEVAQQQLALVKNLMAKNAGSQLELLEVRARVERLSNQLRECETTLPRLKSAAQELQARVAETTAQFKSEARSSLADTQIELQRLRQQLNADNDRVSRTMVVAPSDGIVNKLFFNTVGGVVKPGETLLELTPSDAAIVIETRALPSERGSIQVGQKAIVRIAAYDYTIYGTLAAKVAEISPDSLVDERGERYFRVVVAVSPDSLHTFKQNLSPGMTASADAVIGQRTILQFLLSPIQGLASTAFRERK